MGSYCAGNLLTGERASFQGRWDKRSGFSCVALGHFTSAECEGYRLCLAWLVGGNQRFREALTGSISTQGSEEDDVLS